MNNKGIKSFIVGIFVGVILMMAFVTGALVERKNGLPIIDKIGFLKGNQPIISGSREVVNEESVVTKVVESATPSVVTVSINKQTIINKDPFSFFNQLFEFGNDLNFETQNVEADIGTGFVISKDGLIVTNKHVVADSQAKYKVVVGKDQVFDVVQIYRDPINDLAILKVNKNDLSPVALGDSDRLKVGQTVIAIGTALGEFRSTVTTGVISGLGRGITAGGMLEGAERLDNVIQTDAAINPGNSGGPLFNSSGEVIGVNVAVSASGQNIGFALPINIVKKSIENFRTTGEFDRPYLGVNYQVISKQAALLNEVPAGAYVQEVISGSPAQKGGVMAEDIIVEIDGIRLSEEDQNLASIINQKKIGDTVNLKIWRDTKEITLSIKLEKKNN